MRGLALCGLDRCAEAISDFNEVVRIEPNIAGYFDNRARALRAAGRYDDALRDSEHAVHMAPTYSFTYYGKALALEGQNRLSDALVALDQAEKVAPRPDSGIWELRGKLLGEQHNFGEAYASYDRALEIDPTNFNVFRTRAITDEAQGHLQDALDDLKRYPASGSANADVSKQMERISKLIEEAPKEQRSTNVGPPENGNSRNGSQLVALLDCRSTEDPQKRLDCYDKAGNRLTPNKASNDGRQEGLSFLTPEPGMTKSQAVAAGIPQALDESNLPAMHDTYKRNQARFFRDYRGKTFSALMPLTSVRENVIERGKFDITMGDNSDVSCAIADKGTIDLVTDMDKGDALKVQGTVKDHTFGVVELEDCALKKIGAPSTR